jgi:ankyrin repeat protein
MSFRLMSGLILLIVTAGASMAAGAGDTAVLDAARIGNWDSVRTLVSKGLTRESINTADIDGTRPLHWAVRADELGTARLLLRAGADPNAQTRLGVTALYLAAQNGNADMVKALLAAGADANQVDRATGESILMNVEQIKTVPYVPLSHPFIERLIGTLRRECLDQLFFWTATDLQVKLIAFKDYFNQHRSHSGLKGETPIETPESRGIDFKSYRWQKHCRGLYQTPMAA